MIILTIRTDKPEAELGLYDGVELLAQVSWLAHRQLAETIHSKIRDLLKKSKKDWHDIKGIVCYKGPGSFTGLRIGITVGNALAGNLGVSIVAEGSDDWVSKGTKRLLAGESEKIAMPEYGRDAHITTPRK